MIGDHIALPYLRVAHYAKGAPKQRFPILAGCNKILLLLLQKLVAAPGPLATITLSRSFAMTLVLGKLGL